MNWNSGSSALAAAAAAAAAAQAAAGPLDKKRKMPELGMVSAESTGTNETVRKEMHNATEKRRREKINTKLNELRELIPHCKSSMTNKADVLHHATEHIKNLHASYNSLLEANHRLQEANSQLANELREMHKLMWRREQLQFDPRHAAAAAVAAATVAAANAAAGSSGNPALGGVPT